MKKLLYPIAFTLTTFLILYSCSAEEEETTPPPSIVAKYSVQIESSSGGSVNNSGGEFTKGTTITVSANHESEYVMEDAVLSFRKLKKGGILIFDDYDQGHPSYPVARGIDGFLHGYHKKINILNKNQGGQSFIQKISSHN